MMDTLGRIPVETRSAPKRENWQLSPHRRGVGELCAWSWRVFCSSCGRPRRSLTKRLRFLHGNGPLPCRNRPGFSWACRYRPQVLQNTRARRPQKSRFHTGDPLTYDVEMPTPNAMGIWLCKSAFNASAGNSPRSRIASLSRLPSSLPSLLAIPSLRSAQAKSAR